MTNFDLWKMFYQLGWATKDDLAKAVQLGLITQQQMDQITAS